MSACFCALLASVLHIWSNCHAKLPNNLRLLPLCSCNWLQNNANFRIFRKRAANQWMNTFQFVCLKLTYNPKGIVFDLLVEALVLISPPVFAVLAGVVWEYSLSWPHLRARECEMLCVCKHFFKSSGLKHLLAIAACASLLTVLTWCNNIFQS